MSNASEVASFPPSGLDELCELSTDESRRAFLDKHPDLIVSENVERLAETVRQLVRVDVEQALHAGDSAILIAEALEDRGCLAHALRAKGNALWFKGLCRPASELMEQAIRLFEELSLDDELGRTLSTSIQPLILLGEYDQALRHAEWARQIFTRHQNDMRLARLDINVANIHHRRGNYTEALAVYQRAYQSLLTHRDAEAIGVVLHNIAVCLISLDDFDRALKAYNEARHFLEIHEMPLLVAQADYNIAHLYYLRGDYERALDGLQSTREISLKAGDAYHAALCDLDQSEIYIDLNLVEEAREMTQRAIAEFERLGMNYELARSLTNLAIAASHQAKPRQAIELFDRARLMFAKEGHTAGEALTDLYQAILLSESAKPDAARRLGLSARQVFRSLRLQRKAIICDLLLCRIAISVGDLAAAREYCQDALLQVENVEAPVLGHRAHFLSGCIFEKSGDRERSRAEYEAALRELETVRSSLEREELKIAFVANKLEVYERLIRLCMTDGREGAPAEEAFAFMERAKCRSLVDAMFDRALPLLPRPISGTARHQIQNLRAQLNWYYHRIEIEELHPETKGADQVDRLWEQARECEDSLLGALRELPASGGSDNASAGTAVVTLPEIRAALEPGKVLLEYFQSGDQMMAVVLNRDGVHLVPLAPARHVRNRLRMLQFQLAKFRLGSSYIAAAGNVLIESATHHLRALYKELVAPLRSLLNGSHLVVVPHGSLHYLPMHILHDGESFLIDWFTISYAPSATIYALSQKPAPQNSDSSLIFGVQDAKAPWIQSEVEEVAAAVPGASLFLGTEATREVLEERGCRSRFVHIATHGLFRTDNPMFSSVRLGTSHLSVYDLYNLHLPVDLLTLSGCGTGLNVVAAGDEPIGLARGLLHAGARSLLLTLWDVHDRSTAEFMRTFYQLLGAGISKAAAVRTAMQDLRERYPHPYYWAPFILVGRAS